MVDRRKGTSTDASRKMPERDVIATYRELAPIPELRGHVRAYFSFVPGATAWLARRTVVSEVLFARQESFCSPLFANGHTSVVVDLGATCHLNQGWTFGVPVSARVIGPLRTVGGGAGNTRSEMVGAYFEPGSTLPLLHVAATELTDHIVNLGEIWGSQSTSLAEDLAQLNEPARVDRLEQVLLERLRRAPQPRLSVNVVELARLLRSKPTSLTVCRLADAAGISRQHLTRVFRQVIGVSPKRYSRLSRFQATLIYASVGRCINWAQVAAELGYADQSHMITEFRELSSLTPEALVRDRWFHPFILEARSRFETRHPGK